jgi:hypothetical protein
MAFVPAKDGEPIPGYRLVEKLGVGGYGEVWKATAPGGLAKAVKIVYGDMGGSRAEQELKALGRIKEVRHPFLLSLERIEVLGGQLFIVTELAEGCLYDRFFQCRKAGHKGIPRDELLKHLRDAAEALDYMGENHGLQHLDIKPQNLLLVGGRIKVADFGLVKDLVGTSVTATGGVTPVYATPEAFDGRVSRYSDQYSLAIVYQEMLTGVRPFPGTTLMQLAAQHTNSPPLLTPLPVADRPVVAKALSKVPEQRFGSCLKMVEALLDAGRAAEQMTPVSPSRRLDELGRERQPDADGAESEAPDALIRQSRAKTMCAEEGAARRTPTPIQCAAGAVTPSGQPGLRPTLFLGVGGLATAALRRLKKKLRERHGPAELPIFAFLLVDTDRDDLRRARQESDPGLPLDVEETLLTPLHPPEHYRAESRMLLRWLDRRWLYGIPRSLVPEGLRPLGRLALVDNAAAVLCRVRELLSRITSPTAIAATLNATSAALRDEAPRVFLITSVAGGTGSGMAVSLAYAVRQLLQELRLSPRGLSGMFLFATSPKPEDQEMARVNVCATLGELSHFNRSDAAYPGDPEHGLAPFAAGHAPFEESYLIHLGEQLDRAKVDAATDTLAEYLCLDASPTGGAFLDQFRRQTHSAPANPREPAALRSFGLVRIGAEGEQPLDLATNLLCRRLAERWLSAPNEVEYLEGEARRQAETLGLGQSALADWQQSAVAEVFGEPADVALPRLLDDAAGAGGGSTTPEQLLRAIDSCFDAVAGDADRPEACGPPVRAALRQVAEEQQGDISWGLLAWLIRLVEVPGMRLRAAELTAEFLARELEALEKEAEDRVARATALRRSLCQTVEADKPPAWAVGFPWFGRTRGRTLAAEGALTGYCRLWLDEVSYGAVVALLQGIRQELGSFVGDCAARRGQLERFAARFRPRDNGEATMSRATRSRPRPEGGPDPMESRLVPADQLPAELVVALDRTFQGEVLERHGGMWEAFAPEPEAAARATESRRPTHESLAEELAIRARLAVQSGARDLNAARLFLQANGGPEQALPTLMAHAEAARPRLWTAEGWEHLVLALPEGPSGGTLADMIATALPDVPATVVHTHDEVILCYEAAQCPLREMLRSVIGPAEVPPDLVRRVTTRLDVSWSPASFNLC